MEEHFLYSDPRWIKIHSPDYICSLCGIAHEGLLDSEAFAPDALSEDDPASFEKRHNADFDPNAKTILTEDFCVVDGQYYYVRSILPLYIKGTDEEYFCFGVWSSLSKENFDRYVESFDSGAQSHIEPCFSYLSVSLQGFPDTCNLKSRLIMQDGQRPFVWISEDEDHPLVMLQNEGITFDEILELQAMYGHDIRNDLA